MSEDHENAPLTIEELADWLKSDGVDAVIVDGVIHVEINGETHKISIEKA